MNDVVASPSDAVADRIALVTALRESLFKQHPVVVWDDLFAVPTPELIRQSDIVSLSVSRGQGGRGFAGDPRAGKSRFVGYVTRCLRDHPDFCHLPIFCFNATYSTRPSELDFYGELLAATGYRLTKLRPAKERQGQCINHLLQAAQRCGDRRIVLFVDEAQVWSLLEWTWLKGVDTALAGQNVKLIVIPVAQPELAHVKTTMIQAHRQDLAARYLRRIVPFRAVDRESKLRKIFEAFDRIQYPLDAGCALSEFFFPRAFNAQWRFASEAGAAWRALCNAGLAGEVQSFGMEAVAFAIQHFFVEFFELDRVGFQGTQPQWEEAAEVAEIAALAGDEPSLSDEEDDEDPDINPQQEAA